MDDTARGDELRANEGLGFALTGVIGFRGQVWDRLRACDAEDATEDELPGGSTREMCYLPAATRGSRAVDAGCEREEGDASGKKANRAWAGAL